MTTAAATITVLGTTDDVTECGICGKVELKGTMVLDIDGDTVYAGFTCGAKMAGRPVRELRAAAKVADDAKRAAEQERRDAEHRAEQAAFLGWVAETYGVTASQPSDLWDKVPGMTPFAIRQAWHAAVAA